MRKLFSSEGDGFRIRTITRTYPFNVRKGEKKENTSINVLHVGREARNQSVGGVIYEEKKKICARTQKESDRKKIPLIQSQEKAFDNSENRGQCRRGEEAKNAKNSR